MRLSLLFIASLAAACAVPTLPGPADIPRLREAMLRDSSDLGASVGLAVALRESGQSDEARAIYERIVVEHPDDAGTHLLLGLISEESEDWARASQAYGRYAELAESSELRESIRRRLRYVHRMEVHAAVRTSIEREAEFSNVEPDARTVGVFPFLFQSADSTLRPLSRALASFLVTDLSRTDRLSVLERVEVQLLLDELRLAQSGRVDIATAAQAGRVLRAGKVIQGTIEGDEQQLRLGAVVVGVGRDSVASLAPIAQQAGIDQLFDMEKQLALGLYGSLGIVLTVAEEELVLQRPTANLQAMLAYGRGLEAEDRGDFAEAARQYASALALDPDFVTAEERAEDVNAAVEAEVTPVPGLVETAVEVEEVDVTPTVETGGGALPAPTVPIGIGPGPGDILGPNPGPSPSAPPRDAGPDVVGDEGLGISTLLRLIFRRPVG